MNNNNSKKAMSGQSFIHGAAVLMISTAIVKVIGAIFKLPLTSIIGVTGMGYFSVAYDLYVPIYTLAMAGLPVAISRIVAERLAQERYKDVRQNLKVVRRTFMATGLAGFVIMLIASYPFVLITHNQDSLLGILIIAPSLLFCCIMSTYRGYYEGFKNMYPTAISSVIEAAGKLFVGYAGALLTVTLGRNEFAAKGTVFGKEVIVTAGDTAKALEIAIAPYAAAAALLGITAGSALGALYLVIKHRRKGDTITPEQLISSPEPDSGRKTFKVLISIAIPVVLGSLTTNIASLIDVTMVQRQLAVVMENSGQIVRDMYGSNISPELDNGKVVTMLYGCYKGVAYSIYNLVPTITQVLGVSAIPALATAWAAKRQGEVKGSVESVLKISALIAMPCGLGIAAVSGNVLGLLYSIDEMNELNIATPILQMLGITAVFSGMMVPMTNMLQAIGKQTVPVRNIAIGAALKIIINYVLVGIPSINIMGAPIGTMVCYIFIFSANLYSLLKYSGVRVDAVPVFVKPLIAALACGGVAFGVQLLLLQIMGSSRITTVAAIGAAAVVYIAMLLVLRAISYEDVASFPKGEKVAAWLKKRRLIS